MGDSERPAPQRGHPPHHNRRIVGCLVLALIVAAVVAVLVWIDSQHTREPPHNDIAPVQAPPETGPVQPQG